MLPRTGCRRSRPVLHTPKGNRTPISTLKEWCPSRWTMGAHPNFVRHPLTATRPPGLEPGTPGLEGRCSDPTELRAPVSRTPSSRRDLNPRPHPYQGCALPLSYASDRGGGTRTPNRRFWRPVLYQLSYAPPPLPANRPSAARGKWLGAESNRRHRRFQRRALPPELPSPWQRVAARCYSGGGIRTHDLVVNSHPLWPLSYPGSYPCPVKQVGEQNASPRNGARRGE